MLSITKLQNLKAIHNLARHLERGGTDVINHKTTKFESNSQRYKCIGVLPALMLSITKLQNLKAIHNPLALNLLFVQDVINHKTTKFESNSQRPSRTTRKVTGCYQSQNYKI